MSKQPGPVHIAQIGFEKNAAERVLNWTFTVNVGAAGTAIWFCLMGRYDILFYGSLALFPMNLALFLRFVRGHRNYYERLYLQNIIVEKEIIPGIRDPELRELIRGIDIGRGREGEYIYGHRKDQLADLKLLWRVMVKTEFLFVLPAPIVMAGIALNEMFSISMASWYSLVCFFVAFLVCIIVLHGYIVATGGDRPLDKNIE